MDRGYLSGAYTMVKIGDHFGVHCMTVSCFIEVLADMGVT